MSAQTTSIAPALFRAGSLVAVTFEGPWTGQVTVDESQQQFLGLENVDGRFLKKGQLILLPGKSLSDFDKIKKSTHDYLSSMTVPFVEEIRNIRLVKNSLIEQLDTFFQERRMAFERLADQYVSGDPAEPSEPPRYSRDKAERRQEIIARYPSFAPFVDQYYLSPEEFRKRCKMRWMFFRVQDLEGFNTVMEEKKQEFAQTMNSYIQNLASEFRTGAVTAALEFKKGMDRAKAHVDERVVQKFKDFIARFREQDMLGDVELHGVLNDLEQKLFAVSAWDVKKDAKAMEEIRGYLNDIGKLAEAEGAAADVAQTFVRNITAGDMQIEATAEQAVGGEQIERGMGESLASSVDAPVEIADPGSDRSIGGSDNFASEVEVSVPLEEPTPPAPVPTTAQEDLPPPIDPAGEPEPETAAQEG